MDMRGLNFANRARHRGESVRPDLWPDHAWVPALGCQGGVLYDLCGAQPANITGPGVSWGSNGLVFADDSSSNVRYAISDSITLKAAVPWSIFCVVTLGSTFTNYPVVACFKNDWGSAGFEIFTSSHASYGPIAFGSNNGSFFRRVLIGTDVATFANKQTAICITYNGLGATDVSNYKCYIDSVNVTIGTSGSFSAVPMHTTLFGHYSGFHFIGTGHNASLFWRELSQSSVSDLYCDYSLPFRRRVPVFYSVPSGTPTTDLPIFNYYYDHMRSQ